MGLHTGFILQSWTGRRMGEAASLALDALREPLNWEAIAWGGGAAPPRPCEVQHSYVGSLGTLQWYWTAPPACTSTCAMAASSGMQQQASCAWVPCCHSCHHTGQQATCPWRSERCLCCGAIAGGACRRCLHTRHLPNNHTACLAVLAIVPQVAVLALGGGSSVAWKLFHLLRMLRLLRVKRLAKAIAGAALNCGPGGCRVPRQRHPELPCWRSLPPRGACSLWRNLLSLCTATSPHRRAFRMACGCRRLSLPV